MASNMRLDMRIISCLDAPRATGRSRPPAYTVATATETPRAVTAPARALATQRDVLFFQAQTFMLGRQMASPVLVAHQAGQLWPVNTNPTAASEAYRSASLPMVEMAPAVDARA